MRLITRIPSVLGLVVLFSSLFYLYENRNLIEHGNLHSVDYWHSIRDAAESRIPRLNPHHQKPLATTPEAAPVGMTKTNTTTSPLQVTLPKQPVTPAPAKATVAHSPAKSSASKANRVPDHFLEPSSTADHKSKATTTKAALKLKEPGHDVGSSLRQTGASHSPTPAAVKSNKSVSGIQSTTKKGQKYNGPRRNSLPMPYPAGMLS